MFIAANWKMYLDKSGVEEFSNIIQTYKFNNKIPKYRSCKTFTANPKYNYIITYINV